MSKEVEEAIKYLGEKTIKLDKDICDWQALYFGCDTSETEKELETLLLLLKDHNKLQQENETLKNKLKYYEDDSDD